jgi:hypothetical protein
VPHPQPDAPRGPLFATPRRPSSAASAAFARITPLGFVRCKHPAPSRRRHAAYTRPVGRALVLNASHQPLAVVPARRAVILVLKDKAEVLVPNGQVFRSERVRIEAPSVLRCELSEDHRCHSSDARARDEWTCRTAVRPREPTTCPRSRGGAPGTTSWRRTAVPQGEPDDRRGTSGSLGDRCAGRFRLSIGRLEPSETVPLAGSAASLLPLHVSR